MTDSYPPGPTASRQELLKFARDPLTYLVDIAAQYGEFCFVKMATRETYVVTSPALLHTVLVDQAECFVKTDHTRDSASRFFGEGLLVSEGDQHRRHRRTMQPLFTPGAVKRYTEAMLATADEMLSAWPDRGIQDVASAMLDLALNVIGKTVFGVERITHDQALRDATSVAQQYTANTLVRSKLTTLSEADIDRAVTTFDDLVRGVLKTSADGHESSLVALLRTAVDPATGKRLSDTEIRDEALTILMAGHETTANGLAFTLYLLAKHPDIQEQTRSEVMHIVGQRPVTDMDLPRLSLLDNVIRESLRLYPPAWLLGRTPIAEFQLGGYTIKPDANLVISPYVLHRNCHRFPDPEVFRPERFASEPERLAYLPFGAGPHVCIGQPFAMLEMGLVLTTLLQRFHLALADNSEVLPEAQLTLRPKGGLRLHVERF